MKLSTAEDWGAFKDGEASHMIYPTPTPTLPFEHGTQEEEEKDLHLAQPLEVAPVAKRVCV
jgi:hypothetical protein